MAAAEKLMVTKKNTFFSLGAVSSIIGASMFIAGIKDRAENNSMAIIDNKTRIEKVSDEQQSNSRILSKIEGKLDILIKRVVR